MIIDTSQGNVEVIGDIKEFKTSIDPKNLEFITTLLSSNLYSDPEQSFIREIVSNAWDSHVEAGNTDTPVIIRFQSENYSKSITIRDYGTGLSPERFAEVYCNIGSSTKRDSNNFIGGFGIGKYSSLACSNTVYITSYYNGIAYYYIMVKSGNSITTNLLREQPTTEKNGVEVTIRNIDNFYIYSQALDYIIFFPNIYVDGISHHSNSVKLKRFNNFAAASCRVAHKLLLGNVLYPCNKSLLPKDVACFITAIENTGIVIKFDIGELGITPNRENIIYTSDTIDKISEKIRKAKDELLGMANSLLSKDYTDIYEFYSIFKSAIYYDPITNAINDQYQGIRLHYDDLNKLNITYKGVDLKNQLEVLRLIFCLELPSFKAVLYNDKFYTTKMIWNIRNWNTIKTKKLLICKDSPRLASSIKAYLKEAGYDMYAITGDINKADLAPYVDLNVPDFKTLDPSIKTLIIDGVYEHIINKAKVIDFKTDSDYLNFKAILTSSKTSTILDINETILYTYTSDFYIRTTHRFTNLANAISYIKGLKRGIIISNMDEDERFWTQVAEVKGFKFFKAKKETVNKIRELNLNCVVDMGWLLREDPLINKIYTVHQYFPNGISENIKELKHTVNSDLFDQYMKMYTYYYQPSNYVNHCKLAGKLDKQIADICINLRDHLDKFKIAKSLVEDSIFARGATTRSITAAVIMKSKLYRINSEAYKEVKQNKLLKILCRK